MIHYLTQSNLNYLKTSIDKNFWCKEVEMMTLAIGYFRGFRHHYVDIEIGITIFDVVSASNSQQGIKNTCRS